MSNFYVYAHYTETTNELFYVGKGRNNRYLDTWGRNSYWHKIVKKHGFKSEILIKDLDEPSAFIQEILAIKELNPKANFTKGGSGGYTGPNKGNFKKGYKPWNTGKKCEFISERQKGEKNHMYGKPSATRRKVICLNDGMVFDSVAKTHKHYKVARGGLYQVLNGSKESIKGLRFDYAE